jgi:hypothetical protein
MGPWEITFGAHKGRTIDEVPDDYVRWLLAGEYQYVALQELWHARGHKPDEHPDIILQRIRER